MVQCIKCTLTGTDLLVSSIMAGDTTPLLLPFPTDSMLYVFPNRCLTVLSSFVSFLCVASLLVYAFNVSMYSCC